MIVAVADRWYTDVSEGHEGVPIGNKFKVLQISDLTLDIVDEHGERRTVNRMIFESQCKPLREPIAR